MRHWKEPLSDTLPLLVEGYQIGLENGDLEYSSYCAASYCSHKFFTGFEIGEMEREATLYSNSIAKLKQETAFQYVQLARQAMRMLTGQDSFNDHLSGRCYSEEKMLPLHTKMNDKTALGFLYFHKLFLFYLFHNFPQAVKCAEKVKEYLSAMMGLPITVLINFYDSLAQLGLYPEVPSSEKRKILNRVTSNQKKLKKWAWQMIFTITRKQNTPKN